MREQTIGTVKWFNNQKGIGFIQQTDGSDVFVHYKSIVNDGHKTLKKGQSVVFSVTETEFGVQATEVQLQPKTP